MTEQQEEQKKGGWIRTTLKITFFVTAFLLIIFTVLANIGGSSDNLKGMIEEVISDMSGYESRIEKLNNVSFFPNISVDFEGLKFYGKSQEDYPVASADRVQFSSGFWDVAFRSGKIKALNLKNFKTKSGVFWNKAIEIKSFGIVNMKDGKASVEGTGLIDQYPVDIHLGVDVFGKGRIKKYKFGVNRGVTVNIGDINLQGFQEENDGVILFNVNIGIKEEDIITGELQFSKDALSGTRIEGFVKLAEKKTALTLDLNISFGEKTPKITGKIIIPAFHINDIANGSGLNHLISELNLILGNPDKEASDIDLSFADLDIELDIKELHSGDANIGFIKMPISLDDAHLKISAKGEISEGNLKLSADLDAQKQPVNLKAELSLSSMNYGILQEKLFGHAEISGLVDTGIHLEATGKSYHDLAKNLKGNITFIAGEGRFASGKLNLWGGGLINAIMPDFNSESEQLKLNCAVMDFSVEGGIAKSRTMFLDGAHVMITGEGQYDIAADNLDISLKPKSKDISIGDVSAAVNIKGPLANPSISPDILDLGARLGGLLLGVVNPAFLAFTLTDMGLGDDHPCAGFIGEAAPAAKEKQ